MENSSVTVTPVGESDMYGINEIGSCPSWISESSKLSLLVELPEISLEIMSGEDYCWKLSLWHENSEENRQKMVSVRLTNDIFLPLSQASRTLLVFCLSDLFPAHLPSVAKFMVSAEICERSIGFPIARVALRLQVRNNCQAVEDTDPLRQELRNRLKTVSHGLFSAPHRRKSTASLFAAPLSVESVGLREDEYYQLQQNVVVEMKCKAQPTAVSSAFLQQSQAILEVRTNVSFVMSTIHPSSWRIDELLSDCCKLNNSSAPHGQGPESSQGDVRRKVHLVVDGLDKHRVCTLSIEDVQLSQDVIDFYDGKTLLLAARTRQTPSSDAPTEEVLVKSAWSHGGCICQQQGEWQHQTQLYFPRTTESIDSISLDISVLLLQAEDDPRKQRTRNARSKDSSLRLPRYTCSPLFAGCVEADGVILVEATSRSKEYAQLIQHGKNVENLDDSPVSVELTVPLYSAVTKGNGRRSRVLVGQAHVVVQWTTHLPSLHGWSSPFETSRSVEAFVDLVTQAQRAAEERMHMITGEEDLEALQVQSHCQAACCLKALDSLEALFINILKAQLAEPPISFSPNSSTRVSWKSQTYSRTATNDDWICRWKNFMSTLGVEASMTCLTVLAELHSKLGLNSEELPPEMTVRTQRDQMLLSRFFSLSEALILNLTSQAYCNRTSLASIVAIMTECQSFHSFLWSYIQFWLTTDSSQRILLVTQEKTGIFVDTTVTITPGKPFSVLGLTDCNPATVNDWTGLRAVSWALVLLWERNSSGSAQQTLNAKTHEDLKLISSMSSELFETISLNGQHHLASLRESTMNATEKLFNERYKLAETTARKALSEGGEKSQWNTKTSFEEEYANHILADGDEFANEGDSKLTLKTAAKSVLAKLKASHPPSAVPEAKMESLESILSFHCELVERLEGLWNSFSVPSSMIIPLVSGLSQQELLSVLSMESVASCVHDVTEISMAILDERHWYSPQVMTFSDQENGIFSRLASVLRSVCNFLALLVKGIPAVMKPVEGEADISPADPLSDSLKKQLSFGDSGTRDSDWETKQRVRWEQKKRQKMRRDATSAGDLRYTKEGARIRQLLASAIVDLSEVFLKLISTAEFVNGSSFVASMVSPLTTALEDNSGNISDGLHCLLSALFSGAASNLTQYDTVLPCAEEWDRAASVSRELFASGRQFSRDSQRHSSPQKSPKRLKSEETQSPPFSPTTPVGKESKVWSSTSPLGRNVEEFEGPQSALKTLQSSQPILEPTPDPIMLPVGGGNLNGERAVEYLGRFTELLQAQQSCVYVLSRLSYYRRRWVGVFSNNRASSLQQTVPLLTRCFDLSNNFIFRCVSGAIKQSNEGESFDQSVFLSVAHSVVVGKDLVKLLLYQTCFLECQWNWLVRHLQLEIALKTSVSFSASTVFDVNKEVDRALSFFNTAVLCLFHRIMQSEDEIDSPLSPKSVSEFLDCLHHMDDHSTSSNISLEKFGEIEDWLHLRSVLVSCLTFVVKGAILRYFWSVPSIHDESDGNVITSIGAKIRQLVVLLSDLISLEPLLTERPDVVLMCLEFDAQSVHEQSFLADLTSRHDEDTMGNFFFKPKEDFKNLRSDGRLQWRMQIHQHDAVAGIKTLFWIASILPVDDSSIRTIGKGIDSSHIFQDCRRSLFQASIFILSLFSVPVEANPQSVSSQKYAFLEGVLLDLIDHHILASLPLKRAGKSSTSVLVEYPALKNVLNNGKLPVAWLVSSFWYSSAKSSASIRGFLLSLQHYLLKHSASHRMLQLRVHLLRKLNALRLYVGAVMNQRLHDTEVLKILEESGGLGYWTADELGGWDLTELIESCTIANKRRGGAPLRAEDLLAVQLLFARQSTAISKFREENPALVARIRFELFRVLRRRYSVAIAAAALTELVHSSGFGWGLLSACQNNQDEVSRWTCTFRKTTDMAKFHKCLSLRGLLLELKLNVQRRYDLKHKSDIRLIGSETAFNHIIDVSRGDKGIAKATAARKRSVKTVTKDNSSIVNTATLEYRRRLLDKYTGTGVDPVEMNGYGCATAQAVLRLALHGYTHVVVSDYHDQQELLQLLLQDHSLAPPSLVYFNQMWYLQPFTAALPPVVPNVQPTYSSHSHFEFLLEHGHQLARELVKQVLDSGEWEEGGWLTSALQNYYKHAMQDVEIRHSNAKTIRDVGEMEEEVEDYVLHRTDSVRRIQRTQNPFDDLVQPTEITPDNAAFSKERHKEMIAEVGRAHEKLRERSVHDGEHRPFPLFYAIKFSPSPCEDVCASFAASIAGSSGITVISQGGSESDEEEDAIGPEGIGEDMKHFFECTNCTAVSASTPILQAVQSVRMVENEAAGYASWHNNEELVVVSEKSREESDGSAFHENDDTEFSDDMDDFDRELQHHLKAAKELAEVEKHMAAEMPHIEDVKETIGMDVKDSVGSDNSAWMMVRVDPTAFVCNAELANSFIHSEKRAHEKGETKGDHLGGTDGRLNLFLPNGAFHSLESQLTATFPEYRVLPPTTHTFFANKAPHTLATESNFEGVESSEHYVGSSEYGVEEGCDYNYRAESLFKTIQVFVAFPVELCEVGSSLNEAMEEIRTEKSAEIANFIKSKRNSRRLSNEGSESQNQSEDGENDGVDGSTIHTNMEENVSAVLPPKLATNPLGNDMSSESLWERCMHSTHFYVYAYEHDGQDDGEENEDPVLTKNRALTRFNNEESYVDVEEDDELQGSQILRYTIGISYFEVDGSQFNQPTSSVPGVASLPLLPWLSPTMIGYVEAIQRMNPASACGQILVAQGNMSQRLETSVAALTKLGRTELTAQPAGDLVHTDAIFSASISTLSNMLITPHTIAVGTHNAAAVIAAETERRELIWQNYRKHVKRDYMRARAEYEERLKEFEASRGALEYSDEDLSRITGEEIEKDADLASDTEVDVRSKQIRSRIPFSQCPQPPEEPELDTLLREHNFGRASMQLNLTSKLYKKTLESIHRSLGALTELYKVVHLSKPSSSQEILRAPVAPVIERRSSRYISVERFGKKPEQQSKVNNVDATAITFALREAAATKRKLSVLGGVPCLPGVLLDTEMTEEQVIWMEWLLWIDAHFAAISSSFAI